MQNRVSLLEITNTQRELKREMEDAHIASMGTFPRPPWMTGHAQPMVIQPPRKIRKAQNSTYGGSPTHSVYTTHSRQSGTTYYEPQNRYNKYE